MQRSRTGQTSGQRCWAQCLPCLPRTQLDLQVHCLVSRKQLQPEGGAGGSDHWHSLQECFIPREVTPRATVKQATAADFEMPGFARRRSAPAVRASTWLNPHACFRYIHLPGNFCCGAEKNRQLYSATFRTWGDAKPAGTMKAMVWTSFLTFVTDTPDLTNLSANSPAVVLPTAITCAIIHRLSRDGNSISLLSAEVKQSQLSILAYHACTKKSRAYRPRQKREKG